MGGAYPSILFFTYSNYIALVYRADNITALFYEKIALK